MVAPQQRRLKASLVVAILETLVILAACAVAAHATGGTELLGAAVSAAIGMGLVLVVQWHGLKDGRPTAFQPELMPAIVVSLVVTRAFSATLPDTMSGPAMLSLELVRAIAVGGAMGAMLSLPVIRNATTAVVRALMEGMPFALTQKGGIR